jgi:hypothetical protein
MSETPKTSKILPLKGGDNTFEAWQERIKGASDLIDLKKADWDGNLDRYLVKSRARHQIVVPKDYANVEQKKAQLAFKTPEILLEPQLPNLQAVAPIFESVLNFYLGPKGVNAQAAVDECLTDALAVSGIFGVKICYEATVDGTKPVQVGEQPVVDPMTGQAAVDPMTGQPQMQPVMQEVPNIIFQRYIYERISPAKLLIPTDFQGSDYDKAPWLGFKFQMPFELAKLAFSLPDNFSQTTVEDEDRVGSENKGRSIDGRAKMVTGYEVYYKAAQFDPEVKHPEHKRILVIIDGVEAPVRHEDSPYQVINPDGTLGGQPGFPIHIGALRYVPDSAMPPADVQMSKSQVDELSKGRTHMALQRERSVPMRFGDLSRIGGEEGLQKLKQNEWNGILFLDALDASNPPIVEVQRGHYPQENFSFDQTANRDIAEAWAMGANQSGSLNETGRTATELTIAQNNSNTRLDKERLKFQSWFVRSVEKLAALIQMFADEQAYVRVIGPDNMPRLQAWDKQTIAGEYAFTIKPNSGAPQNVSQERAEFTQMYNILRPSPFINGQELDAEMARKFGMDPAKLIVQPSPKPADVPKISYAFKGEDLNPLSPSFPIVIEILRQGGIVIPDEAVLSAQKHVVQTTGMPVTDALPQAAGNHPPPGSGAQQETPQATSPINKHQTDRTGARPGPRVGGQAKLK